MRLHPRLRFAWLLVSLFSLTSIQPASAEWTLALFIGGARTNDSPLTLVQPGESTAVTLSPVSYGAASFDAPIYYGYRAGFFQHAGWLGFEGEFIHLKVIADTARSADVTGTVRGEIVSGPRPIADVIEQFSITHGVNLLLMNVVARREAGSRDSSGSPRWILAARGGVGATVPHAESTVRGIVREQYEWGALSLQAASGVELRVTQRLYVTGEYKLTRTVQDVSIVSGSARAPLITHHGVVGVTAHIGRR